MNYRLDDIELVIDDAYFEVAEGLLAEGKVLERQELDNHLWVFKIEDEQVFEVEIQISPSRVKACTCDCGAYAENGICVHIVTALLCLRQEVRQRKAKKAAQKQKPEPAQKLTTNAILRQVDAEALRSFVAQYARNNRSFALALKARFGSLIPLASGSDPYAQLLDSIIRPLTRDGRRLSTKGVRQIAAMLEQLLQQAEEAASLQEHQVVFDILHALFNKVGPVISMTDKGREQLVALLQKALELLRRLLMEPLAPQMQEQIWQFALAKSTYGAFFTSGISLELLRLLLPLANSRERQDGLYAAIEQGKEQRQRSKQQLIDYLLLELQLLEQSGQKERSTQLIQDNLMQPEILLLTIEQAMLAADYPQAQRLAEQGLASTSTTEIHYRLRDQLLQIAIIEGQQAEIKTLALACLLDTYDFKYFKLLKAQGTENWSQEREQLIHDLRQRPYTLAQRDLIAAIFVAEQDFEQLMAYIQSIESIDLLMQYDERLLAQYRPTVYSSYKQLLHNYLSNHLGRQSSQKTRQIIEHLYQIEADDLAKELVQHFRAQYASRHSLMEELQGL
ncbi:MAG: SWIM zinc finger family protein [Bacteroidota bacterium]